MSLRALHLPLATLLLAAGCKSSGTVEPEEPAPPRPAPSVVDDARRDEVYDPVTGDLDPGAAVAVARIGGDPVPVSALITRWFHHSSPEAYMQLSQLVAGELAEREAQRLGIRLRAEDVDEHLGRVNTDLERHVHSVGGESASVEEWIAVARGVDPARYLERLRAEAMRQLLAEYAIRAWVIETGHVRVRLAVLEDREALDEARDALAAGATMAEVARRLSIDETAEQGGLVRFLVATELSPLSRLATHAPIGEVTGPIEDDGRFLLLQVEERTPGRPGPWDLLGPDVTRSLAEHPVEEGEFRQWQVFMEGRYEVDFTPFLELAGEPVE